jgi:hypothetical protein
LQYAGRRSDLDLSFSNLKWNWIYPDAVSPFRHDTIDNPVLPSVPSVGWAARVDSTSNAHDPTWREALRAGKANDMIVSEVIAKILLA